MILALLVAVLGWWLLRLALVNHADGDAFVSKRWLRQQERTHGLRGWSGANSTDYQP